jgi:hypothetical protein
VGLCLEGNFLTQVPVKIYDMGNNGKLSFYKFSPYDLLGRYKEAIPVDTLSVPEG